MRIFVHLINVSSKLHLDKAKHQARGIDKDITKEKKEEIQAKFINRFNMRVEEPRQGGGTSTTGNVARKAFENPKLLAEVLELDETFVSNLSLLISAASSFHPIHVEEFEKLACETKAIYLAEYGNIPMNVYLHKLLDHGGEIINSSIMPTGYFGEDGSEGKNKEYRNDRLHFARKTSRTHNMEDVFKRSLARSDIFISLLGVDERLKTKKHTLISTELSRLLILDQDPVQSADEDGIIMNGDELDGNSGESDSDEDLDDNEELEFYFNDGDYQEIHY